MGGQAGGQAGRWADRQMGRQVGRWVGGLFVGYTVFGAELWGGGGGGRQSFHHIQEHLVSRQKKEVYLCPEPVFLQAQLIHLSHRQVFEIISTHSDR